MFTITIENMLRFHEYFDDKMISMKNFPLGFGKIRSALLSCGFFAQMWKNLEEKRSCKYSPPSWILSRGQQVPSSFQSPRSKNVTGVVQMDCV